MFTPKAYFKNKYGRIYSEKFDTFMDEYEKFTKQYNLKNNISLEYLNERFSGLRDTPIEVLVDLEDYRDIHNALLNKSKVEIIIYGRFQIYEYLFNETALRLGWVRYKLYKRC